jgi:DNA-binding transcriptional LysR family regulator
MPAPAHELRFPSIEGLRAFEAASRLGTFERAADELAVTASAVSKRVATLEDLVGTPLLLRTGKSLALTSAGKEYLGQVSAALGLLSAMPLHHRAVQRIERLRVTTPPTFARQILVPQLESFTAAHPQVELELLLSIPYLDSSPHEADVEVRTAADKGEKLLDDQVVAVASPALLARLPPLRTPADLAAAPLLRTPLEPWTPWFRAAGLDWSEPSSGPRLVDLGMTMEAAVSGQGVALARPTLARHWLATGTLRPLFPISCPTAHPYFLLPREPQGAAADFVRWLVGLCREAERASADWLAGLRG